MLGDADSEAQWEHALAAIDTAQRPDDVAAPGRTVLELAAADDQARARLMAFARMHPKAPAALQLGGQNQEKLVGEILGWDAVAAGWCRFYEEGDAWNRWAEQLVISLILEDRGMSTHERWSLVLGLLEAAASEKVLGNIGAGPLEDLLSSDPEAVAHLIEREAPRNQHLRLALRHTWQFRTPNDVFAKVKRNAEPNRRADLE